MYAILYIQKAKFANPYTNTDNVLTDLLSSFINRNNRSIHTNCQTNED